MLMYEELSQGKAGEPYAVRYKFGWSLNGCFSQSSTCHDVICHYISSVGGPGSESHGDCMVNWKDCCWPIEHDEYAEVVLPEDSPADSEFLPVKMIARDTASA